MLNYFKKGFLALTFSSLLLATTSNTLAFAENLDENGKVIYPTINEQKALQWQCERISVNSFL